MSNTDIVIRGLTTEEAQKLELISKRRGYQSRNQFLIDILRSILVQQNFSIADQFYRPTMEEILRTEKSLLEKAKQQGDELAQISRIQNELEKMFLNELKHRISSEENII